ncbi:MAG: PEP-CTERM sorting domain-containing protein [Alkalilacustris sp.]
MAIINTWRGVPGGAVLDGSNTNASDTVIFADSFVPPPPVGVNLSPSIPLLVEVGRPFEPEKRPALNLNVSNALKGAAFGVSALIEFDQPKGVFITSERGYSQGVPADLANPSVIPLPASGVLVLLGFGLMGWASRRRHICNDVTGPPRLAPRAS